MLRAIVIAALLLAGLPAKAASIIGASYDASKDEIVVDIVYLGTKPGHEFGVEWGACSEAGGVVGRLIDRQGGDLAKEEFQARQRIALGALPCRPAEVTLRLGKVSHMRVYVPALK